MFGSFDISASGLVAQRVRLETIANNMANATHTRAGVDAAGKAVPYRRQVPVFETAFDRHGRSAGVKVTRVTQDKSDFRRVRDPGHPDAGPDGYVSMPNVDMATEYVNALEATRAYEANITAMEASKSMIAASLRLLA